MTAALSGLLVAAGAGWLSQQLGVVSLPTPTWEIAVKESTLQPAPGQSVELLTKGGGDNDFVKIGDATIRSVDAAEHNDRRLVVGSITMDATHTPDQTQAIRSPGKNDQVAPVDGRVRGIPIFQPVYLQVGGAGLFLVAGALLILWVVGLRPGTVDFLIATDAEMKKVNWSTRREIVGSTQVVIIAFFLIAAIIFAIDFLFQGFFELIRVIRLNG
jgi:preprotein translocase subunit SecE